MYTETTTDTRWACILESSLLPHTYNHEFFKEGNTPSLILASSRHFNVQTLARSLSQSSTILSLLHGTCPFPGSNTVQSTHTHFTQDLSYLLASPLLLLLLART